MLIDKGTWTQASPHVQTQVLGILRRPAPPPVSPASGKGQLHLLGCSGTCFESGVPHTLPMCSLSPMPLPPLIICHLTTVAATRLDPLLAPHTPPPWWQNRSQLCSGSEGTFQLQVKTPRLLCIMSQYAWRGVAQTSLQGPQSCFHWFQI